MADDPGHLVERAKDALHGFRTGREHHLLSDLETGLFLMLDWSESVVDVREQFPLNREATRMLAQRMGIAHPRDTGSKTDIVMTSDFVAIPGSP